jgi:hypothetical protein
MQAWGRPGVALRGEGTRKYTFRSTGLESRSTAGATGPAAKAGITRGKCTYQLMINCHLSSELFTVTGL